MTTTNVLLAAKARLTSETWGKGHNVGVGRSECVMSALGYVVGIPIQTPAYPLLSICALGHPHGPIYKWNDAPERTFADVHALFDAAIAIAQEQEQAAKVFV